MSREEKMFSGNPSDTIREWHCYRCSTNFCRICLNPEDSHLELLRCIERMEQMRSCRFFPSAACFFQNILMNRLTTRIFLLKGIEEGPNWSFKLPLGMIILCSIPFLLVWYIVLSVFFMGEGYRAVTYHQ